MSRTADRKGAIERTPRTANRPIGSEVSVTDPSPLREVLNGGAAPPGPVLTHAPTHRGRGEEEEHGASRVRLSGSWG